MKSPLVEALRQASGSETSSDEETPKTDEVKSQTASEAANEPAPASGLELMETMEILPIDGATPPVIEDPVAEAADVGEPVAETRAEETTGAAGKAVEPVVDAAANSAVDVGQGTYVAAAPVVTPKHGRIRGLPRIGLFTPLICLMLAGSAIAMQYVWHGLKADRSGLSVISSRQGANNSGAAVPGTIDTQFPLIQDHGTRTQTPPTAANAPAVMTAANAPDAVSVERATNVTEDKAFAALNAAYDAFEAGDMQAAEAGYREALELAPRHPNALHGLAAILHRDGRQAESLRLFEVLLSVDPDNATAAAALIAAPGETAGIASESEIKHLIQQHPKSAHLRFALGGLMAQRQRWPEARHAFEQAIELDPGNADYRFNLAVSLEHLGYRDDARWHYQMALDTATAASSLDSDVVVARIDSLGANNAREGQVK